MRFMTGLGLSALLLMVGARQEDPPTLGSVIDSRIWEIRGIKKTDWPGVVGGF